MSTHMMYEKSALRHLNDTIYTVNEEQLTRIVERARANNCGTIDKAVRQATRDVMNEIFHG